MSLPVRIRVTGDVEGLKVARRILSQSLRGGLTGLGKLITPSIQSRMRRDRGDERESVRYEVRGRNLTLSLSVYSELVQAIVDELGLPPGTFPPHRTGTRFFRWVAGKTSERQQARANERRESSPRAASHLRSRSPFRRSVAAEGMTAGRVKRARERFAARQRGKARRPTKSQRAIEQAGFLLARSVFEKGIKPTMPFSKGLDANRGRIMRELQNAVTRAVTRINRGG